jgi:rubrerythrin
MGRNMMKRPSESDIAAALERAAGLHHEYERKYLKGKRDDLWSGFYAAFVLGRCGEFTTAEELVGQLESISVSDNWNAEAAARVFDRLVRQDTGTAEATEPKVMYICPRCFRAADKPGNCPSCGSPLYEFHPGDEDDPCRCPVVDSSGEIVTHAPLWWLRCVAPDMIRKMRLEGRRKQQ